MKKINWRHTRVVGIAAVGLTMLLVGVCLIGGEPIPNNFKNVITQMLLGGMLTCIGLLLFYSASRTLEDMKDEDKE